MNRSEQPSFCSPHHESQERKKKQEQREREIDKEKNGSMLACLPTHSLTVPQRRQLERNILIGLKVLLIQRQTHTRIQTKEVSKSEAATDRAVAAAR
jgi:hypothetical protein